MKMRISWLAVLVLAVSAFGQTAPVIELKPADAAKAKQLYEAMDKLEKEVAAFREQVYDKYVAIEERQDGSGWAYSEKFEKQLPKEKYRYPGFGYGIDGFEFAKDFRFIVPKVQQVARGPWDGGCLYMNPATYLDVPPTTPANLIFSNTTPQIGTITNVRP